jgi:ParB-like chromosome segregation protein Spo0J
MEKNNFGIVVDISDSRKKYLLLDFDKLEFKAPSNADILQGREFYGSQDEIDNLMASIKERGLLESPIVMEPDSPDGKYRVLEGNRRCFAVGKLLANNVFSTNTGKSLLKLRVEARPNRMSLIEETVGEWVALNSSATQQEIDEVRAYVENEVTLQLGTDALVRNTQRLNWSHIEMAHHVKSLMDSGMSLEYVASQTGYAVNTIKSRLSLLSKAEEVPDVIQALDKNQISITVGKLLSNVKDEAVRAEVLTEAVNGASSTVVKELINKKEEEAKKEGNAGIKAQHRAPRSNSPTKSTLAQTGTKKESQLLEAIASLSAERDTLAKMSDEVSQNTVLDLEIGIKVLQWCVNADDTTPLIDLFLDNN